MASLHQIICKTIFCFVAKSITEMTQSETCFTHYVISSLHRECKNDLDCDTYMTCCQNTRNSYSVCTPFKGRTPLQKSRLNNADQEPQYKNYNYIFNLPQPSPIPLPILDQSYRIKSWKGTCYSKIWDKLCRWNASNVSNILNMFLDTTGDTSQ